MELLPEVSRYPASFREMDVKFREEQTVWIPASTVGLNGWGEVENVYKNEMFHLGLQQSSWIVTAKKFGVSHSTVRFWGKKAGLKLKLGGLNRTKVTTGKN